MRNVGLLSARAWTDCGCGDDCGVPSGAIIVLDGLSVVDVAGTGHIG
jgi:hypothetical protein